MSSEPVAPRFYTLKEGVRVFRSGDDEIRFRKGVWNFNEAVVKLSAQPDRVVRFFGLVADALIRDDEVNVDDIGRAVDASAEELDDYCELLESLRNQQFLYVGRQRDATRIISALLGGNLSGFEEYVGIVRPVMFFADTDYATQAAKTIAKEINLPLDIIDATTLDELAGVDLTTCTDAIAQVDALARFERLFSGYACVLGCVATPNLSLLRNLNRILVRAEKPLILGMIDGPFLTLLSTLATESGCFECYEQRMMARLEDTLVYHKFVQATANMRAFSDGKAGTWFSPALHSLTGAVLSEGYLYSALNMLRLAGRIVNVYLPLLEIQAQDLLRVPYCPACGFISTAQMDEMYTSSRQLVSQMLARVDLER